MKILVTGAGGQLGMSLRKVAGEYPDCDLVFTDLPEADITDGGAMRGIIEVECPGALVNCAAYTAVDRAESEPGKAGMVNVRGPEVLASLAAAYGFTLVHISTDYVFDGRKCAPYTETDAPSPLNVYGRTKLGGEERIEASGCDAVIIRTSWLYSEFGSNFVRTMLRLAAERHPLSVVDDQTGSPTYAGDLARAVLYLLGGSRSVAGGTGLPECDKKYRILNYAGDGNTTWFGFAREIFRQAGLSVEVSPVRTETYPAVAVRPAFSALDTSLAKASGLKVRPWRDSLEECLRALGRL